MLIFLHSGAVQWSSLKALIKSELRDDVKWSGVDEKLRDLWKLSRELVGSEESSDVIDDACLYLLRLFLDQKIVMLKHMTDVKKIFGQVTSQLANKICAVSHFC